jgi:hypothetical protein
MIITDLHIDAYHAHDAISSSKLKVFRESPLLYKRMFLDRACEKERTKALDEGAGFDSLLFDGEAAFAAKYICKPPTYPDKETGEAKPWNGNAGYCKAWAAKQDAANMVVLDADAYARFALMRDAIRKHPLAAALLGQGVPQVSFRCKAGKFDGLELQVRPDWYSEKPIEIPALGLSSGGLPYLLDLKTTADFNDWFDPIDACDPRAGSPVWKFGYHRQGGLAQIVCAQDIGKTAHFLLVVEKSEPFRVGVVCLNDEYLDLGWAACEADLNRLALCRKTNTWPGSPTGVIKLPPPSWLLEKGAREAAVGAA